MIRKLIVALLTAYCSSDPFQLFPIYPLRWSFMIFLSIRCLSYFQLTLLSLFTCCTATSLLLYMLHAYFACNFLLRNANVRGVGGERGRETGVGVRDVNASARRKRRARKQQCNTTNLEGRELDSI